MTLCTGTVVADLHDLGEHGDNSSRSILDAWPRRYAKGSLPCGNSQQRQASLGPKSPG
jgi:hypothetical protein